jgi:thiol:disulfide interchange protein
MKKVRLMLIMLLSLSGFLFAACKDDARHVSNAAQGAESTSMVWVTDFSKGMELAKAENKPVMVDFYADWCGWCKKLDREVYSDPEVVRLSGDFVNIKVNTDVDRRTPSVYRVSGLPTVYFLDPEGKVISQIVGYRNKDVFAKVMTDILDSEG